MPEFNRKSAELAVSITEHFDLFLKKFPAEELGKHPELNAGLLVSAISLAQNDLQRRREFHAVNEIGPTREAATTAYWIYKSKPVLVSNPDALSGVDPFINEMFCISLLLSWSKIDRDDIPDAYYADLMYQLKYRHLDVEMLYLIVTALQISTKARAG